MSAFPPPYDPNNVFKKIIAGQIPSHKIFETDACVAILDAFPTTPGHALLIPKGEYATMADLPPDVAAAVFRELPRLMKAVVAASGAEGCNVVANSGRASGQEVFHAHLHVIPRTPNDALFKLPASASSMIEAEAAKAMLSKMQPHL